VRGRKWGDEIGSVKVADFVLPAWFESFRPPNSAVFDYCNHIRAPFEILPHAYVLYVEQGMVRVVSARHRRRSAVRLLRHRTHGGGTKP